MQKEEDSKAVVVLSPSLPPVIPPPPPVIPPPPPPPTTDTNSQKKKKNNGSSSTASPVSFVDINDEKLAKIIEQSVRFKLPDGGIHKPCVWYSHPKNWGVFYRVYAKIPAEQIKNKGWKSTIIHLKWNFRNNMLMPNRGYEEVEKIIDEDYTEALKEIGMKG